MNSAKNKFPDLFQFLGCYFHQDWNHEYKSETDAIQAFITNSTIETLSQTREELRLAISAFGNEEKLYGFLFNEMGCSYYYPYAWPSGKAWLEHLFSTLKPLERNHQPHFKQDKQSITHHHQNPHTQAPPPHPPKAEPSHHPSTTPDLHSPDH